MSATPQFMHGHSTARDQLPTALGQATAAKSLAVVLASDQTSIPVTVGTSSAATTTLANNVYASTNVTTAAYVELIHATTNAINNVRVFDSSGSILIMALGAAGLEVDTIYIPPGGSGTPFLIAIPAGSRISLKALDTNATTGRFVMVGLA